MESVPPSADLLPPSSRQPLLCPTQCPSFDNLSHTKFYFVSEAQVTHYSVVTIRHTSRPASPAVEAILWEGCVTEAEGCSDSLPLHQVVSHGAMKPRPGSEHKLCFFDSISTVHFNHGRTKFCNLPLFSYATVQHVTPFHPQYLSFRMSRKRKVMTRVAEGVF